MFYEINKSLCDRYGGLNPLSLLDYPAEDVFNLIADTINYNNRQKKSEKAQGRSGVIRKQAGDNWF